mmetsp:Transcript_23443/g.69412  ORF Transcript_23443/g.69412 Transcript_23443/m.69412 type:complete len:317 (-) Transcript_23443:2998-3948(-)
MIHTMGSHCRQGSEQSAPADSRSSSSSRGGPSCRRPASARTTNPLTRIPCVPNSSRSTWCLRPSSALSRGASGARLGIRRLGIRGGRGRDRCRCRCPSTRKTVSARRRRRRRMTKTATGTRRMKRRIRGGPSRPGRRKIGPNASESWRGGGGWRRRGDGVKLPRLGPRRRGGEWKKMWRISGSSRDTGRDGARSMSNLKSRGSGTRSKRRDTGRSRDVPRKDTMKMKTIMRTAMVTLTTSDQTFPPRRGRNCVKSRRLSSGGKGVAAAATAAATPTSRPQYPGGTIVLPRCPSRLSATMATLRATMEFGAETVRAA